MVSEDIHVSDPTAKKKTSKQYKIRTKYDKKKKKKEKQTFENVAYTKI